MLTSAASRPTFVALYQSPDGCDSSGISSRAIAEHYSPFAVVDGTQILVRTDR